MDIQLFSFLRTWRPSKIGVVFLDDDEQHVSNRLFYEGIDLKNTYVFIHKEYRGLNITLGLIRKKEKERFLNIMDDMTKFATLAGWANNPCFEELYKEITDFIPK